MGSCSSHADAAATEMLGCWLMDGLHADMDYMARTVAQRLELRTFLPWAKGAFVVALPYNTSRESSEEWIERGRGWVSRYAWGRDYHKVLKGRLAKAAALLESAGYKARVCVDTAPVRERALAVRAGLGFIGKNGMLINREFGSYLFLGEVITDLALDNAGSAKGGCGGCTLCLKACPTEAIVEPRIVDSRRCLSYWTIEHRRAFSESTPLLVGHLFGCDGCQEACPYNKKSPLSGEGEFQPRDGLFAPFPEAITGLGREAWDELTRTTALRRARYEGLLRNACRIIEEAKGE